MNDKGQQTVANLTVKNGNQPSTNVRTKYRFQLGPISRSTQTSTPLHSGFGVLLGTADGSASFNSFVAFQQSFSIDVIGSTFLNKFNPRSLLLAFVSMFRNWLAPCVRASEDFVASVVEQC